MEKKKMKATKLISLILGIIILVAFIVIMVLELALPQNSDFTVWAKENVFDITLIPQAFAEHYKVIIHCVIFICFSINTIKANKINI